MPRPAPDPKIAAKRGAELARIVELFGGNSNAAMAFALMGHQIRPDNIKRLVKNVEGRCASDELMAAASRAEAELSRWQVGRDDKGRRTITHLFHPLFTAPIVNGALDEANVRWLTDRGLNFRAALADARRYLKSL